MRRAPAAIDSMATECVGGAAVKHSNRQLFMDEAKMAAALHRSVGPPERRALTIAVPTMRTVSRNVGAVPCSKVHHHSTPVVDAMRYDGCRQLEVL